MKLLLVEDEIRMAEALRELLKQEGYDVDWYANGEDGLSMLLASSYDCAILDVMLPGISGFEITVRARKKAVRTPILLLTAKGELEDKVFGLDCGADDYLTKPFQPAELLARVRAMCRRNIPLNDGKIQASGLSLDPKTLYLSCTATGEKVRLSEKECRILEYLMTNSGQILTREQIAVRIWGYDSDAEYNNVEVYITFVRRKLNYVHATAQIKSVRGAGYTLSMEEQET